MSELIKPCLKKYSSRTRTRKAFGVKQLYTLFDFRLVQRLDFLHTPKRV